MIDPGTITEVKTYRSEWTSFGRQELVKVDFDSGAHVTLWCTIHDPSDRPQVGKRVDDCLALRMWARQVSKELATG